MSEVLKSLKKILYGTCEVLKHLYIICDSLSKIVS